MGSERHIVPNSKWWPLRRRPRAFLHSGPQAALSPVRVVLGVRPAGQGRASVEPDGGTARPGGRRGSVGSGRREGRGRRRPPKTQHLLRREGRLAAHARVGAGFWRAGSNSPMQTRTCGQVSGREGRAGKPGTPGRVTEHWTGGAGKARVRVRISNGRVGPGVFINPDTSQQAEPRGALCPGPGPALMDEPPEAVRGRQG